jgi:hypothetical protein
VKTGSAARGRRDLQTSTTGRREYVLCAVGVGEGGAASTEAALAGRGGRSLQAAALSSNAQSTSLCDQQAQSDLQNLKSEVPPANEGRW